MNPRKPPAVIDTEELEISGKLKFNPQRIDVSRKGMVATQHYKATQAGARILAEGGNAVDAAVAAAFTLGVCEPAASGLGGQTMMLLYQAETRRTVALDGSSRAPNRIRPGELIKEERLHGYRAATVPSTPATLGYTLQKYGTMKLPAVLQPAIELATDGYQITELQYRLTKRELKHLRQGTASIHFLKQAQRPHPVGAVFKQPVLADTLKRITRKGIDDFYQGKIAKSVHADMQRNGGFIHLDDLAHIPWPVERRPVSGRFRGMRLFSMPPPGSGRTLIELCHIVSQLPEKLFKLDTPKGALMLAEAIRRSFIDRRDRPFDPAYYPQVDDKRMLSDEYAALVAKQINTWTASHGDTTHLSAMDRWGNAVALTQSIERVYGSCAATEELGFLYNNYACAFEHENISHPYYLRPNAVPWASVAPTIIFRGRKPWIAIGSPGSDRIPSSILQVLLRIDERNLLSAVTAPRLHCSINGKVYLESSRMRTDIPPLLERYGFKIVERDAFSFYLGCVQYVMREGDEFIGVADPRRDGSASGPAS